jgi:hypothetical protein
MSDIKETKIGPTEGKQPGHLNFDHDMFPDAEKMAPGDKVKLVIKGHLHANRGKDEFGPGHTEIHVHSIEHHVEQDGQKPVKKPNWSTARMDELKKHLEDLTENDKNMEGHSESGVKEQGNDEVGKDAHND